MPSRPRLRRALLLLVATAATSAHQPFGATRGADDRVRDLLARMTPEEKFAQLYVSPGDPRDDRAALAHGAYGIQLLPDPADTLPMSAAERARRAAERINRVQHFFTDSTRLGIPALLVEEGVHGLVQPGATVFPAAIALAATWDTARVAEVAAVIAQEARARGIRQLIAPVLNLGRDPRWGRTEETFGEDPRLASAMGAAMVRTLEGAGVVTTPKHLIANFGDGGRDSWPVGLSWRTLEGTYAPPFRAALGAGARSVMAAYNAVDGVPATQSRDLLTARLRGAWGFGGLVISDQAGVGGANVLHFTAADYAEATTQAFAAGLDVIFQSRFDQARLFSPPVLDGRVPMATVDSAVARVLRLKVALGLFDAPYVTAVAIKRTLADSAPRSLARDVAAASLVLLRNERQALPLTPAVRRVLVLGPDATQARLGGYTVAGARGRSIADGLRDALGARATVTMLPGVARVPRAVVPVDSLSLEHETPAGRRAGLRGEYFHALDGSAPVATRDDPQVDFHWTLSGPVRALSRDWYAVRWTGALVPRTAGTVHLGVEGNDGWRLWLGDSLMMDNWGKRSHARHLVPVRLTPGRRVPIRLEYRETTGNGHVRLVWNAGVRDDDPARIREAVAAARTHDAVVVVAGIEEGEFRDRASLALPGKQEPLIRAVAATGTPVTVVVVGGGAVTMPWLDKARAVLLAWYPGQAGGDAVADVLTGRTSPAGRLPFTMPVSEGQLPLTYDHEPTGRGDDYVDLTGQPLFPFGHGLSYTTFAYDSLVVTPAEPAATGPVTVRARVRNTGPRAGDEVVQLYVRRPVAPIAQPVLQLAAFARVALAPGEARTVAFTLDREALGIVGADGRRVPHAGPLRLYVGSSSRELALRATATLR